MEPTALLRFLNTYKWLIGGAAIAAAIFAGVVSTALPVTYGADARILVGPPLAANVTDYTQLLGAQTMAQTYAEAATTNSMAARVIERLGLSDTPELLLRRVTSTTEKDSAIVTIGVEDATPDGAARIANAIAEELIASSAALQGRDPEVIALVQEQIAALRAQIADIDARIAQLQPIAGTLIAESLELDTLQDRAITSRQTLSGLLSSLVTTGLSNASFLDQAVAPMRPSSPKVLPNVIVAIILGLVLGLAAAAVLRAVDDTIKTGDDIQSTLGLPLLGAITIIPTARGRDALHPLVMLTDSASPAAEAFRSIRTNLEYASRDRKLKTVLVTSPSSLDGKSTVAANLALAFAQAGRSTILVDADLRSPSIHRMFRLQNERGLSTLLLSDPAWWTNLLWNSEMPNLRILCSGPIPPSPADLLGTARLASLLEQLGREADVAVIDSPALHAVTDAALLAAHVDAAVLVIGTGRTRRDAAIAAEAALHRVSAPLIGAVLNRRDRRGAAPKESSTQRFGPQVMPAMAARELAPSSDPLPFVQPYTEPSRSHGEPAEERR